MEYELYHHGIKGMKWGVRRYQNKDGTLTAAGKRRARTDYASEARSMSDQELRSKVNRLNLEKRYYDMSKSNSRSSGNFDVASKALGSASGVGRIAKGGLELAGRSTSSVKVANQGVEGLSKSVSAAKKISDISASQKAVKRNRSKLENMSDQDLRDAVNRMDLERQYSSLRTENVNRGRTTVSNILDVAGDVLAVGASAITIAVGINKLLNGNS